MSRPPGSASGRSGSSLTMRRARRARPPAYGRLQADVSALDPREVMAEFFGGAELWGELFSPPCPSFSMAGKGEGRAAIPLYQEAMIRVGVEGKSVDRDELDELCGDERAHLILEPLRWALALKPQWIALEQVEPCLPLWETMAACLRQLGYQTWTGMLSAERYGVPQTRRRAILLASLAGPMGEPPATRARYIPPRVKPKQEESLFDTPEPERIVAPEDRQLLPWISMEEALGWGMTARPYLTVASGRETGGPDKEKVGGSGAREVIYGERDAGRWAFDPRAAMGQGMIDRHGPRDAVPATEPAPVITGKTRSAEWVTDTGNTRSGSRSEGRSRRGDEPAPVITSRADQLERRDEPPEDLRPSHYDSRQQRDTRSGDPVLARRRSVEEPAPTIAGESRNDSWVRARDGREDEPRDPDWPSKRPATTVAGDPRLAQPGHKNEEAMPDCPGRMEGAIRVSVDEAAVLQDFPLGYPWQGSRTAMYRQIGDAVPPGLARAVIREALRHELPDPAGR